jgi:DNA repair protein RecO (recombination protein O)
MSQVRSEGIILRSVDWKENSRIVTFLTDNAGRQSIIDRGGRSIKSKRGRLHTFSRLEIVYFKSDKSGMGYLEEVSLLEPFLFEKEGTLGRLTFASAALEILNDLLADDEPQEEIYLLTLQYFRLVDSVPKGAIIPVFLGYFIKVMSFLGYRPNFSGCAVCGKSKEETILADLARTNGKNGRFYFFSPERGGLVCSSCQMMGEYYIKLHPEKLEIVGRLQTSSLTEASGLKIKMVDCEEILELLTSFLRYQTGAKELNSLKFLEKLRKTQL